jgi:S-adenosylmethionine/arginine decarboxylase-like enzyme
MENINHFVLDLYNCDKQPLKSTEDVGRYLEEVVKYLGLKSIGKPSLVKFDPINHIDQDGITGTLILSTSLISIHTYPLEKACYIDLFACANYSSDEFLNFSKRWFKAQISHMNKVVRYSYKYNYHTPDDLD